MQMFLENLKQGTPGVQVIVIMFSISVAFTSTKKKATKKLLQDRCPDELLEGKKKPYFPINRNFPVHLLSI